MNGSDFLESGELARREFLKSAGGGMVALTVIITGCGGGSDGNPPPSGCTGIERSSTVVDGHTHTLCVPQADLSSPPAAGQSYTTSVNGHAHEVTLTAADLMSIAGGGTVTVTTSITLGHAHMFTLKM
jgi:hypothetical protein